MKKDLLDHGYVRLVSYTQPAADHPPGGQIYNEIPGSWTGDLEIVRAARVSHNSDWRTGDPKAVDGNTDQTRDERLIHSLWKRGHTSPFEAMTFSFEVQAPIFVFRQWHRHRTQSYSEVSARYTELPDLFYVPLPKDVGVQDPHEKQARMVTSDEAMTTRQKDSAEAFTTFLRQHGEESHAEYKSFLELGVPRELARMVLPLNVYSRMYASANLLNWFRFIGLRSDPHAQYEIRVYSDAILDMIATVCPIACAAFESTEKKL